jgi:hypothetical protein
MMENLPREIMKVAKGALTVALVCGVLGTVPHEALRWTALAAFAVFYASLAITMVLSWTSRTFSDSLGHELDLK